MFWVFAKVLLEDSGWLLGSWHAVAYVVDRVCMCEYVVDSG